MLVLAYPCQLVLGCFGRCSVLCRWFANLRQYGLGFRVQGLRFRQLLRLWVWGLETVKSQRLEVKALKTLAQLEPFRSTEAAASHRAYADIHFDTHLPAIDP